MSAGHYGIFSGRRWREHVHPEVSAFIALFGSGVSAKAAPAKAPARKPTVKKKAEAKVAPRRR